MCSIDVTDDVKKFVEELVKENGLSPASKIEYTPGAEAGEGYTSKPFIVDIVDGDKSLHLFLKVPIIQDAWPESLPMRHVFKKEVYFYDTVYPAYQSFLKEKGFEDCFHNVPKCYGTKGDLIALENLRYSNFRMFPKGETLNEDHIVFAMRTFAKFHAISYAIKDQKKEFYETLSENVKGSVGAIMGAGGANVLFVVILQQFLKALDPVEDKDLVEASGNLMAVLGDILVNVDQHPNEYAVITQGDCWSNNIMYLYEGEDTSIPTDIRLVDWQMVRHGSPAIDLAYFFYTIASESTIEKYEDYLKIYHKELSTVIRKLSSDPDTLYPFHVLTEEWKKYAKFGFASSFFIIRHLLVGKEEVPKMEDMAELFEKMAKSGGEGASDMDLSAVFPEMKNQSLYLSRLKLIFRHCVKHNFLE